MKLGEIDVHQFIDALGTERSAWINVAKEESRKHTEAEKTVICVLAALEHALRKCGGVFP